MKRHSSQDKPIFLCVFCTAYLECNRRSATPRPHSLGHVHPSLSSNSSGSRPLKLTGKIVCCCLITKSRPTLCHPRDYSLAGSSVHGISQARVLEWVAISFSRQSSWPRDQTHVPCIGTLQRALQVDSLPTEQPQKLPTGSIGLALKQQTLTYWSNLNLVNFPAIVTKFLIIWSCPYFQSHFPPFPTSPSDILYRILQTHHIYFWILHRIREID